MKIVHNISIIICTYNRQELLDHALDSIRQATHCDSIVEVLVINNNPSQPLVHWEKSYPYNIRYVNENSIGLSYARNKGAEIATGEWLLYLDDDGTIEPNTLIEAINTIENYDFAMFTGIYKAWDYYGTPKWFPDEWANYQLKGDLGVRTIDNDYVTGGIMAVKKDVLIEVGGFPTSLGMVGQAIAYGEENYVERKIKLAGLLVGINTNMQLNHVVGKHKHSLSWLLKAYYAKGKAIAVINNKKPNSFHKILFEMLVRFVKNSVRASVSLVRQPNYYYQNFILDTIGPLLSYLGMLRHCLSKNSSR